VVSHRLGRVPDARAHDLAAERAQALIELSDDLEARIRFTRGEYGQSLAAGDNPKTLAGIERNAELALNGEGSPIELNELTNRIFLLQLLDRPRRSHSPRA